MTDYLDAELAEPDEVGPEEGTELTGAAGGNTGSAVQRQGARAARTPWGAEELPAGQVGGEAWAAERRGRSPRRGAAWSAQAAVPAGGRSLTERLRRTAAAAEYRGRGTQMPTGTGADRAPKRMGAAELDMAFERDARRYDGGFELY